MERKTGKLTMKKQLNYADIIKEVLILTGAVAIIAAAVYENNRSIVGVA